VARFGRSNGLVVLLSLLSLLSSLSAPAPAQDAGMLGQSISWRLVTSPFTPSSSEGAIAGGPGNDPSPGTPMYICRARVQGSLTPGKWVQGNCNVPFGGSEQIMRSYEVAYGSARWGAYRGNFYGLAQTGRDVDGTPLYSCRVNYVDANGNGYGYQPGKLVASGTCNIPFGGAEVIQPPPFEALYATGGGRPPWTPGYPSYPPYPAPPAQQPYPACKLGDRDVHLDITTGWWVGPNCSSIDSQGRITQLKYPQPQAPPGYAPIPQGPPPYNPGPSSVTWQPAQKPFVPGADAIKGGPGKGPQPGSPLFVCRVQYQNNLYPGKWMQGSCRFADGQHELVQDTYEVATGPAEWRDFDGNIGAMVPGGYTADGTQLYICRKDLGKDKGLQPGWLGGGRCHIPYNYDTVSGQPFQALYNVFGANGQPGPPNQPSGGAPDQGPQAHGILISFGGGTGATAGMVTVTNGATGTTASKPLPPNSSAQQCLEILQQAALQAGLQIQQADAGQLKVFGTNNAVHISQASTTVSQF
jgi:Protein of unknown function (DUF3421)